MAIVENTINKSNLLDFKVDVQCESCFVPWLFKLFIDELRLKTRWQYSKSVASNDNQTILWT